MKKLFCLILALPVCCFAQPFVDVPPVHPNSMAIDWLFFENLVEGYTKDGEKIFLPEKAITRAAALKMLIGTAGTKSLEVKNDPFPDVPRGEWFAPYIQTALDSGIVNGYADGKFHPAAQVTRAEFLAMALRTFNAPISEEETTGDWSRPFFDLAIEYRIVDENDATHEALDRGDVAELLFRVSQVANSDYQEKFHYSGQGIAGWLGIEHDEKKMTNGQEFDRNKMTVAHRDLPLGTRLRIWNSKGNAIIATVTDRYITNDEHVLVLTEKAFGLLDPDKGAMVSVQFEVYSEPSDEVANVPEYVRPELSDEIHNQPSVPTSVGNAISSQDIKDDIQPLWDEVVPMLGREFYEDIEMRDPFPQKVLADTVINLSGRAKEMGHERVVVFLQQLTAIDGRATGEQQYFVDELSGKNFVVPVHFPNAGIFQMGVVLDDNRKSRVETIEVIRLDRERLMKISSKQFDDSFEIRLTPEKKELTLDLPVVSATDLVKVEFKQGDMRDKIVFEGGISEFTMPYSWFYKFDGGENLAIDVYVAESRSGTVAERISGWQKVTFQNYDVIAGFRDIESEKISIHEFPRWKRGEETFNITGTILSPGVVLPNHSYMISPSGKVRELPLTLVVDDFSFPVTVNEEGAYTIEVVEDSGEVLFNRQLFVSEEWALPVLDPIMTELPSETVPGVRAWINRVRNEAKLNPLIASVELNEFAQNYADRMAQDEFISHTSSTGQTFSSRLGALNIDATEFGENLGFGTNLQLALDELRASGSHLTNIVSRRFTHVGIGITKTTKGWYVSQVFSR